MSVAGLHCTAITADDDIEQASKERSPEASGKRQGTGEDEDVGLLRPSDIFRLLESRGAGREEEISRLMKEYGSAGHEEGDDEEGCRPQPRDDANHDFATDRPPGHSAAQATDGMHVPAGHTGAVVNDRVKRKGRKHLREFTAKLQKELQREGAAAAGVVDEQHARMLASYVLGSSMVQEEGAFVAALGLGGEEVQKLVWRVITELVQSSKAGPHKLSWADLLTEVCYCD
jgi:hypothetical protein